MFIDEKVLDSMENKTLDANDILNLTILKFRKAATSKCFSDEDIRNHFRFMSGMLKSRSGDLFRIVKNERPLLAKRMSSDIDQLPDEVA